MPEGANPSNYDAMRVLAAFSAMLCDEVGSLSDEPLSVMHETVQSTHASWLWLRCSVDRRVP